MIYTFIPYSIKGNLAKAYDSCMALIGESDLALFTDYDVIFTRRNWYEIFDNASKEHTDIGIFTCYTNRIKTSFQIAPGVDSNNHDIKYHMKFGKELYLKHGNSITVMDRGGRLGGFAMLIRKRIWNEIKTLKEGIEYIDIEIGKKCHSLNIKIARLNGLYAYHWRRGINEGSPDERVN